MASRFRSPTALPCGSGRSASWATSRRNTSNASSWWKASPISAAARAATGKTRATTGTLAFERRLTEGRRFPTSGAEIGAGESYGRGHPGAAGAQRRDPAGDRYPLLCTLSGGLADRPPHHHRGVDFGQCAAGRCARYGLGIALPQSDRNLLGDTRHRYYRDTAVLRLYW